MNWIAEKYREAAQKVAAEMAKPMPEYYEDAGDHVFDPWELFPCIYGTYSEAFDDMALVVLRNIILASEWRHDEQAPEDLAHEIFREMLCTADLCEYGTSPRVCFATPDFAELLPQLVDRWDKLAAIRWRRTAGTENSA